MSAKLTLLVEWYQEWEDIDKCIWVRINNKLFTNR